MVKAVAQNEADGPNDWQGTEHDDSLALIDTTVPCQLNIDEAVFLNLEQGTSVLFVFEVESNDRKVLFKNWERELRMGCSEIDIYVSVNDEEISETNYSWKYKFGC